MQMNTLLKRLVMSAAMVASLATTTAAWAQCPDGYTQTTMAGCITTSRYFLFIKIGSETTCETTTFCLKNW